MPLASFRDASVRPGLDRILRGWRDPARAGDADAVGAAAVLSCRARWALLAAFALVVMLRLPHAWAHGRFMDEEGTIFFAYAWHRPAAAALFRSFGGYLNIGANATTLVVARLVQAGLVPLARAPYWTMATALAVQLLPAGLLLTGRARWLESRWSVLAALLLLATGPMTEEVFFNVLHIQFQLAMAAALILAVDAPAGRGARIGYGAILFLAPLCGPGAIILLPFFGLRALIERDTARLAQALALGLGTGLQLLVFFAPIPVRGHLLDPLTLAAILFVRMVALPLAGSSRANRMGAAIHASYVSGGIGWWCAAAAAILAFGVLIVLAWRARRDGAVWLIVPGLAIAAASFGGGMIDSDSFQWFSVGAGERYNFVPLALGGLSLIALAHRAFARGRDWPRVIWIVLCLLAICSGIRTYFKPIEDFRNGPHWNSEVALWQADHDHPLASWPADWSVDLSDRDRSCMPARLGGPPVTDPSYCESHWLARVVAATERDRRSRH